MGSGTISGHTPEWNLVGGELVVDEELEAVEFADAECPVDVELELDADAEVEDVAV